MIRYLEYIFTLMLGIYIIGIFPILIEMDDERLSQGKEGLPLDLFFVPIMVITIIIRILIRYDKNLPTGYKDLSNLGLIALVIIPLLIYIYGLLFH